MNPRVIKLALLRLCALFAAAVCVMAHAAERVDTPVGTVVFLAGEARLERAGDNSPLTKGQALLPGDRIHTGADGHVHVRMIDEGFVAVRASSRLLIQDYVYKPDSPAENKVRIQLETGVARTVSGKAGESARERYRFNTPVAAIGLRGTDYVVQASADLTRVSVLRGEVSVSPFGGGCSADALAPCAGELVRELNARTPHAYLEVRSRGGAPVLVSPENGKDAPNRTSPAHPEEPRALIENPLTTAHATDVLARAAEQQLPRPDIAWGRWQHLSQLNSPTFVSVLTDDREITVGNELFGLVRPAGSFAMPQSGQVALNYAGGEAYARATAGAYTAASLSNAALDLDFNRRTFSTSLVATTAQVSDTLRAQGRITFQGMLYGNSAQSTMNVAGALSSGAKEAGYLFDATLSNGQTLIGATRWKR